MIAKLSCALKKSNLRVIENVCSHYAVSAGEQPGGNSSDELRVGRKRAAASTSRIESRSEYEIYSFATRHNLLEAATNELIQLVSNARIFSLWSLMHDCTFLML